MFLEDEVIFLNAFKSSGYVENPRRDNMKNVPSFVKKGPRNSTYIRKVVLMTSFGKKCDIFRIQHFMSSSNKKAVLKVLIYLWGFCRQRFRCRSRPCR